MAPEGFDARFSALWRRYSYRIADGPALWDPLGRYFTLWHKEPLDVGLLNEGAAKLLGLQDFRSYCKPREGATTIRELQRFEFARGATASSWPPSRPTRSATTWCGPSWARRCTWARGWRSRAGCYERLLARKRDAKSVLAAPHPLVLEEVAYPSDAGLLARAELTRALRE